MKKTLYVLISSMFLLSLNIIPINAQSAVSLNSTLMEQESSIFVPYADVIERVYRTSPEDGIVQYRDWNRTWGRWVQPDWITIQG